jgi:hypothetical protein
MAGKLRDTLCAEKNINISLERAYYVVVAYTKKHDIQKVPGDFRWDFKPEKIIPYAAAVNKPTQPSFRSKIAGFFHREPSLQEYLLSDDQIAHSSEKEYYENIEDEE